MSATLTDKGWVMDADSANNSNGMTSDGRVVPVGVFIAAKVRSIVGGKKPKLELRSGPTPDSPIFATVAAKPGAEIDWRLKPAHCATGIYLTMTGAPASFDVEVLTR